MSNKLESLFHAIVLESNALGPDSSLGKTKLAKLAYFTDFEAYRRHGRSVSGARYVHRQFGPAPAGGKQARDGLIDAGVLLQVQQGAPGRQPWHSLNAQEDGPARQLDIAERQLVQETVGRFHSWSTTAMVELSHQEPGWLATADGQTIAYPAARIKPTKLEPAVARRLALEVIEEFNLEGFELTV